MPKAKTPRAKKPKPPLERDVLKATLALLKHRKLIHIRLNAGVTVVNDAKYGKRAIRGAPKDYPDLLIVLGADYGANAGKLAGCELKRPGERPRPGQLEVLRSFNSAGAIGFWADDALLVERVLDKLAIGWRVELNDRGDVFVTDEPREDL